MIKNERKITCFHKDGTIQEIDLEGIALINVMFKWATTEIMMYSDGVGIRLNAEQTKIG